MGGDTTHPLQDVATPLFIKEDARLIHQETATPPLTILLVGGATLQGAEITHLAIHREEATPLDVVTPQEAIIHLGGDTPLPLGEDTPPQGVATLLFTRDGILQ